MSIVDEHLTFMFELLSFDNRLINIIFNRFTLFIVN